MKAKHQTSSWLRTIRGSVMAGVMLPLLAHASNTIVCTPNSGRGQVVITQDELNAFGASLTCIRGLDTAGQHPCAPPNGYGLQYPTGSVALRTIAYRWQELLDHYGPVIGYRVTGSEMSFEYGIAGGDSGYRQSWAFSIDRVSGTARLTSNEGRRATTAGYRCERRQRAL